MFLQDCVKFGSDLVGNKPFPMFGQTRPFFHGKWRQKELELGSCKRLKHEEKSPPRTLVSRINTLSQTRTHNKGFKIKQKTEPK